MADEPKQPVVPEAVTTKEPALPEAWEATLTPGLSVGDTIRPPGRTAQAEAQHPAASMLGPRALPSATIRNGGDAAAPGDASTGPLFDIVRVLGRGGMGVVYAAEQGSLRRQIALKMISAPPELRARLEQQFVSEALITGDLDHPNIVPIHDLGRDAGGNLFMAMKLVRGRSWSTLLAERPAQPGPARAHLREQLEILSRVCDAVAFAHSRLVVHRDLKPENVMVGEFGEVMVMDWGIALDVSSPPSPSAKAESVSSASACAGTPRYMAPEVARADAASIGPWTDVYLLGGILYEILTGAAPHKGTTVSVVLAAAARGEVEAPDQRAPGREVSRELARIAMKALSAATQDRYADAAAFQLALRGYLAHEESLRLADEGQALLARLGTPGQVATAERYATWTLALGRLSEALNLWPENQEASSGQALAAAGLADEALDRGDTGLAAAQLPLLRANASTSLPAARRAALEAAVTRRTASRWKTWAAAAASVLLVGGLALAFRAQVDAAAAEELVAAGRRDAGREANDAWTLARKGQLAELDLKVRALDGKLGPSTLPADPLDALRWAGEVWLWAQGRSRELCAALATAEHARPSKALADRLLARPELAGTTFGARVSAAVAGANLWELAADEARAGLRSEAVLAILEELSRAPSTGPLTAFSASRRALHAGAVVELAWLAALQRGDAQSAARLATHRVPFVLEAAPFGPASGEPAPAPRLVFAPDAWVGLDPETGASRWRRPTRSADQSLLAIPVADGSLVVAGRGELVRVSGQTGAVLGRVLTGDPAQLAWPDPADRTRVVVALLLDGQQGRVHLLPVRDGKPEQPVFHTSLRDASAWVNDFPDAASKELTQRLLAQPVAPAGEPARKAWVAPLRSLELERLMPMDPENPGLLIRALEDAPAADSARRQALAARVVALAGVTPLVAGLFGTKLERLGFRAEADQLYARAAELNRAQEPNLALAMGLLTSPVVHLRKVGGERFTADPARALALVEEGRHFATFVEGDHRFYRRAVTFLEQAGRGAEAAALRPRIAAAEAPGGNFLLPAQYLIAVDVGMALLLTCPFLVMFLVLRLWRQAASTRRADLYGLGFRTPSQRLLAFLTTPATRLAWTSFRYATRLQRALLVVVCLTFLGSAALVVQRVQNIGRIAATPIYMGSGLLGYPGMLALLDETLAERGPRPPVLRMLAEAHHARGGLEAAAARCEQLLTTLPADAVCLNNLGTLAEAAGDLGKARDRYRQAGAAGGEAGAPGRFNLARVDADGPGRDAALAELSHGDREQVAPTGPPRPLWARVPFTDFQEAMNVSRPAWAEVTAGMGYMLTHGFGEIAAVFYVVQALDDSARVSPVHLLGVWSGYAALLLALLGLLWLPLPVRPLLPVAAPARRAGLRGHWREALAVASLPLPGLWEMVFGRPALGAAMLFGLAWAWAVRTTILTGGLVGSITITSLGFGYFPGVAEDAIYPELSGLAATAGAVMAAIFLLNAALAAARLMKLRRALTASGAGGLAERAVTPGR